MASNSVIIGAVVPLSGTAGVHGPSVCNAMSLAVEQLNASGGLLGRAIKPVFIDGGQKPINVATNIQTYLENDFLDILIGFHDSDVRRAITEACILKVPYIYTPPYEGGETNPAMFMLGETPIQQLSGPVEWFDNNLATKNWFLIGNDYSWPHDLNIIAKTIISAKGLNIVGEQYVPVGTEDFAEFLNSIKDAKPDIVLSSLIGNDAIEFHRQLYTDKQLREMKRFAPLLDENILLGIGSQASRDIYSVSSYYTSLKNKKNADFLDAYDDLFGADGAMITSLGQSCYEALMFIDAVARKSGALTLDAFQATANEISYTCVRGSVTMHNHHLIQDIHLAKAKDFGFDIIENFPQARPE